MKNRIKLAEKVDKYQPPRDLEIFCLALVHQDVKGNKLEAERLTKVSKSKFYYYYRTSEAFRHWYSELCFSILKLNEAIPPYALLGAVIERDVQAIRTYYELIGKLKGQAVNVNTQISTVVYPNRTLIFTDLKDENVSSDAGTKNIHAEEVPESNRLEGKV